MNKHFFLFFSILTLLIHFNYFLNSIFYFPDRVILNKQILNEKQDVEKDFKTSKTKFLSILDSLPIGKVPFSGGDLDVELNSHFDCNTNYEFVTQYLIKVTAIPKKHLSIYNSSSYCSSRLTQIKGMDVKGYPIIFNYANFGDFSRSLVFAIYDSLGNEISSKILVTDDPIFKKIKNPYNGELISSTFVINKNSIELTIYTSEMYGDPNAVVSKKTYLVDKQGTITLSKN